MVKSALSPYVRKLLRVKLLVFCLFPLATAGAASLSQKIEHLLKTNHLDTAKVSLFVVQLPSGTVLYEKNAGRPLNPASTAKLVTAGAALRQLGPDFTFKTEFYSRQSMQDGRLEDFWIKGYGDPLLIDEEMELLVRRFREAGLKEIRGEIYVDDSYFDRDDLMTYLSDKNERIYSVMTGPLSFNFNRMVQRRHGHKRLGDQMPNVGILDPATWTGTQFIEGLRGEGISFDQGLHRQAVPADAVLLMTHHSPPLRTVLEGMGKHSNNFVAEQLFKTLGAVRFGPPGSLEKGRRAISEYLASLQVPTGDYTMENGSGLSKLTRLSSLQLVMALRDLHTSEDFVRSLSVAGVDGTMRRKFRGPLQGKVFAKTGSLSGTTALAGYLENGGEMAAFSMIFNDYGVSPIRVMRTEKRILEAVLMEMKK